MATAAPKAAKAAAPPKTAKAAAPKSAPKAAKAAAPPKGRAARSKAIGGEALWYKDAIIYEVPVRAYRDSNGDGSGDFRGLTEKLDYIRDLGVTAIWILPFYPSPLRDDGYDIADFFAVHPSYGTLRDVKKFIREAHARGLRVITELVCNHTSDQNAWFQKARLAKPGSSARDFYVYLARGARGLTILTVSMLTCPGPVANASAISALHRSGKPHAHFAVIDDLVAACRVHHPAGGCRWQPDRASGT
jgi:hypothetical protein